MQGTEAATGSNGTQARECEKQSAASVTPEPWQAEWEKISQVCW